MKRLELIIYLLLTFLAWGLITSAAYFQSIGKAVLANQITSGYEPFSGLPLLIWIILTVYYSARLIKHIFAKTKSGSDH